MKTSVSLRASTRRRLKTFAAEHDMRIQEVIDAALETYLGFGGERCRRSADSISCEPMNKENK